MFDGKSKKGIIKTQQKKIELIMTFSINNEWETIFYIHAKKVQFSLSKSLFTLKFDNYNVVKKKSANRFFKSRVDRP